MKKLALLIIMLFTLAGTRAQEASTTYFPYPEAPSDLQSLTQRCNYVAMHFWDYCNFKSAFSAREKMNQAVGDFIDIVKFCSRDTAMIAIDNLLAKVAKDPKGNLELARMAEGYTYCDTARISSEEIYLPFVKSVVNNKKISGTDKARFNAQYKILSNTGVGMTFPNFLKFVDGNGNKHTIDEVTAGSVVVLFADPDCSDCRLTRARMAADYNMNKLIEKGLLAVVAIYPDAPDENWTSNLAAYPDNWYVWALPEAYDYFSLPELPSLYYLNNTRSIVGKDLVLDNIMQAAQLLMAKQQQREEQRAAARRAAEEAAQQQQ